MLYLKNKKLIMDDNNEKNALIKLEECLLLE